MLHKCLDSVSAVYTKCYGIEKKRLGSQEGGCYSGAVGGGQSADVSLWAVTGYCGCDVM